MHFAFTVTEETFDEVVKKFVGSSIGREGRSTGRSHSKAGRCSSLIRMRTKQK
jgi:hypothetical protein